MRWLKRGRVFSLDQPRSGLVSHAQCPLPLVLNDRIRIFFASRPENQQSRIVFLDVRRDDPAQIIDLNLEPVLKPGRPGTFDENGLIPSFILPMRDKLYFYYAGWSQARTVPYKNFTGLAISDDGGRTFQKHSEAPVFTLNEFDPLSATGPWVIPDSKGYLAVYSTGTHWHEIKGHWEHTYALTSAVSDDAIHWQPSGQLIFEPKDEFEALCKPTIIKIDGLYHMWFSARGSHGFREPGAAAYRLGYAYSTDLLNWTRDDSQAGLDVSETGWDSEMICYSYIVEVDGKFLMFYNGNGFGRSGFGYAELEL